MPKSNEDKGIVYCNLVRQGNWYEATQLEEVRSPFPNYPVKFLRLVFTAYLRVYLFDITVQTE